jgi:phosphatidylserine/phosphatidylglycerophosphate/cardiolipin synthase-like enzyme
LTLDLAIATFAGRVDERLVRALINGLQTGNATLESTALDLQRIDRGLACRAVLDLLLAGRTSAVSLEALSLALSSSLQTRLDTTHNAPKVEAVWTGPLDVPSALRSTAEVVLELVGRSRSHLLIVGYSITFDFLQRGATGRLLRELVAASERGVKITVILHDDPKNLAQLTAAWPRHRELPTLLTWSAEDPRGMTKLHAKVLVADDDDLLVTSANLTYHGLERNMEVGLRITGATATTIRRQFDELQRAGLLRSLLSLPSPKKDP